MKAAGPNTATVALVDSSKVMHAMVADSLRDMPVVLNAYSTADEAEAALEDASLDLIIVGDNLGGKDGLTFLRELRRQEKFRDIAVVMVTSKNYMQDQQIAKDLGVCAFLIKPMPMQALRDAVENNINIDDGT